MLLTTMLAIVALSVAAGGDDVIMIQQYVLSQRRQLPEKTDEFKMQNYALNPTGEQFALVEQLQPLMDELTREDYNHFVYKLDVTTENQAVKIEVNNFDPMKEVDEARKQLTGVFKHGRCYFILQETPQNANLLKGMVKKSKGKTKFVRVFEMVTDIILRQPTIVKATWKDRQFSVTEKTIAGENKLNATDNNNTEQGEEAPTTEPAVEEKNVIFGTINEN